MSKTLINPFELLGINEKSSIRDARKAYYQLALLCHPDCGGHEESMKVLVNAYTFVCDQMRDKRDITGDADEMGKELEREFEKFNLGVKTEIPVLRDLFELATEEDKKDAKKRNFALYNSQFNEQFEEEQKYNFEELVADDPFSAGYGNLMDKDHDYDTDEEYVMPTKNVFKGEISVYKEPHILPDSYGSNFRYDIKEVDDFSNYESNEFDYKKAHSELENPSKEIKSEMDKPMENIDNALNRLMSERDSLRLSFGQIALLLKD